jgi:hypothetical protein
MELTIEDLGLGKGKLRAMVLLLLGIDFDLPGRGVGRDAAILATGFDTAA